MNKVILNTEIQNVELKPGQVICMYDSKTKTHHNMIVFPCKDRMCAVEELFSTDSIIVNSDTGANYCYLDRQKFPHTLGVSPEIRRYSYRNLSPSRMLLRKRSGN